MTKYRAVPCPCDNDSCKDWRVAPSVRFTEYQARRVARLLNQLEQENKE